MNLFVSYNNFVSLVSFDLILQTIKYAYAEYVTHEHLRRGKGLSWIWTFFVLYRVRETTSRSVQNTTLGTH